MTPDVPKSYYELAAALDQNVYPNERRFIEFKRKLQGAKQRPEDDWPEFAKDAASMSLHGGALVYGVAEDKKRRKFVLQPVDLTLGIAETLDQVLATRVQPRLYIVTHVLPAPTDATRGVLWVEIPTSPDVPHQANGTYYSRSDTGVIVLSDTEVERLMQARSVGTQRLRAEMARTRERDLVPVDERRVGHFYLTAIPMAAPPDMFVPLVDHPDWGATLLTATLTLASDLVRSDAARLVPRSILREFNSYGPGGAGGWMGSQFENGVEGRGERLWLDFDGPVRFVSRRATTSDAGEYPWEVASARARPGLPADVSPSHGVFDLDLYQALTDLLSLIGYLAERIQYSSRWQLGVQIDLLRHCVSLGAPELMRRWIAFPENRYDSDEYSRTTECTTSELQQQPYMVADRLMRRLLLSLGSDQAVPKTVV